MDMELDRIFAILLLVIGAYYIVSANTIRRDKKIRPGDNRHVAPSRINDLDGYCNWVAKWFYILAAVTWFDSAVFFFNIFVRESALLCVCLLYTSSRTPRGRVVTENAYRHLGIHR